MRRAAYHTWVVSLTLMLSAGCGPRLDGAGGAPITSLHPDLGLAIELPAIWGDHYLVEQFSAPHARAVAPLAQHALVFSYLPRATDAIRQPLMRILIFAPADWDIVSRDPSATVGESLGSDTSRVWVLWLPHGNPYPEGSEDYELFAQLRFDAEQARQAIRVDRTAAAR